MLTLLLEVSSAGFSILTVTLANPADFIEIKFEIGSDDIIRGLNAYMNTLLSNNDEIVRF